MTYPGVEPEVVHVERDQGAPEEEQGQDGQTKRGEGPGSPDPSLLYSLPAGRPAGRQASLLRGAGGAARDRSEVLDRLLLQPEVVPHLVQHGEPDLLPQPLPSRATPRQQGRRKTAITSACSGGARPLHGEAESHGRRRTGRPRLPVLAPLRGLVVLGVGTRSTTTATLSVAAWNC